jgi:dihydrofolate reductase
MGKIVVSEFITLDGVVEAPGGEPSLGSRSGWTIPYGSEDFNKFKLEELFAADALLLGRVTYQGFAAAWPRMKDEVGFADRMNSFPKYVVSSSMKIASWDNSRILPPDPEAELMNLKAAPGGDILVFGSVQLARWLALRGLVDEWRLLVYPILLGAGKRLFAEAPSATALELLESRAFEKGLVLQRYGRKEK